MKQENKLKKRKQFKWTFKNGKLFSETHLSLVYVSNKTKDVKIGFSVTKKVGKAVVRNKKKRQMREAVSHNIDVFKGFHTIVFIAKPNIIDADFFQIEKEILSLIDKAGLKKENK